MNEYTEFDTAAEMQKALDRKRRAYGYAPEQVPYQSLTETCEVDQDGIIVDRDSVNELLAKDERPSFAPTEIAAFILAFFLFLALGIDTAMKGDLRAATYTTEVNNEVR